MYKLLLCWRYLLTRYIALVSIISVMLGVATMIIVNAVMLGFTEEMKDRLHGILSDITFDSAGSIDGFPDPEWHMQEIMRIAGDKIEGITPTVIVPGMISFQVGGSGQIQNMPIHLVGIDEMSQGKVSDIMKYLQHPNNREMLSFQLHENGYDVFSTSNRPIWRPELQDSGWEYRRIRAAAAERSRQRREQEAEWRRMQNRPQDDSPMQELTSSSFMPLPSVDTESETAAAPPPLNPFTEAPSNAMPEQKFDATKEQFAGAILGFGLSHIYRDKITDSQSGEERMVDRLYLIPGDDVTITIPMVGIPPKLTHGNFTVVDLYESKMMEYDSKLVFVPIKRLQELRGMVDPTTGMRSVSQILIKAKPGVNLDELRDLLQDNFPRYMYRVQTWTDIQAPTIAAVFVELAILNVLLFLIIAVAGFGILAIFFMIVVEKTKDIGILKSLGASSGGVMQIFLYYSLALGIVGSGGGVVLGLIFVHYIKEIADFLSARLGHEVYDPAIYMFYDIPTVVRPATVASIVIGAIAIAVAAGILPALRAAWMRPVEALRS